MIGLMLLKTIYFFAYLIVHIIGSYVGYKIKSEKNNDLIELFVGSFLLCYCISYLLPNAEIDINGDYPYAALISLIAFIFLTLYNFAHESISLMDDNILMTYEIKQSQSASYVDNSPFIHNNNNQNNINNNDHINSNKAKFIFWDNLPILIYYIAFILYVTAQALDQSLMTRISLNEVVPFRVVYRLFESFAMSKYIKMMSISTFLYCIFVIITMLLPIIILVPLPQDIPNKLGNFVGSMTAIILGVYFYFGSQSVHNGLANRQRKFLMTASVLVITFTLTALIHSIEIYLKNQR